MITLMTCGEVMLEWCISKSINSSTVINGKI